MAARKSDGEWVRSASSFLRVRYAMTSFQEYLVKVHSSC